MRKEFIPFEVVRNNAIKLAYRIHATFGLPDIIYVCLRGGAAMGNVISEYLQIMARGKKVLYAAVVARSYRNIAESEETVEVEGWTLSPDRLRPGDRILFVDDIFDTGRTINHLVKLIMNQGLARRDIAVAVHDYKIREFAPSPAALSVVPDFFCRRHLVRRPEDDFWINYMSHELQSLTREEIARYDDGSDAELSRALQALLRL
jgi:hypoxanthine phosphoribosyltransferase